MAPDFQQPLPPEPQPQPAQHAADRHILPMLAGPFDLLEAVVAIRARIGRAGVVDIPVGQQPPEQLGVVAERVVVAVLIDLDAASDVESQAAPGVTAPPVADAEAGVELAADSGVLPGPAAGDAHKVRLRQRAQGSDIDRARRRGKLPDAEILPQELPDGAREGKVEGDAGDVGSRAWFRPCRANQRPAGSYLQEPLPAVAASRALVQGGAD